MNRSHLQCSTAYRLAPVAATVTMACLIALPSALAAQLPDELPLQVLYDSTPTTGGIFGWSLAAWKRWLAVGAISDADSTGEENGTVTLYERSVNGTFVERQVLESSTPFPAQFGAGGHFGFNCAIDDGRLVVAADSELIPGTLQAGVLHVFELDSSGHWNEVQIIADPSAPSFESRGFQLALLGDHLFVGSRGYTGMGHGGRVSYYFHGGAQFDYVGDLLPPPAGPGINFGWSLDVSQEHGLVLVGANIQTLPGQPVRSGAAYVFRIVGNGTQPYQFVYEDLIAPVLPRTEGRFGSGVAVLDRDRIAACDEVQSGQLHLFARASGGGWQVSRSWQLPSSVGSTRPRIAHLDGQIFWSLSFWRDHIRPSAQGAVIALCESSTNVWNLSRVLRRPPSLVGFYANKGFLVHDDFIAVPSDDPHQGLFLAGAVSIFRCSEPWDCNRATPAIDVCTASTVACPTTGPLQDPAAGCINSLGNQGRLHFRGVEWSYSPDSNVVWATGLPPGEFAVLLRGTSPSSGGLSYDPLGVGTIGMGVHCLRRPYVSLYPIRQVDASGTVEWRDAIYPPIPPGGGIHGPWRMLPFQVWYRDRTPSGGATSNTTNAMLIPLL